MYGALYVLLAFHWHCEIKRMYHLIRDFKINLLNVYFGEIATVFRMFISGLVSGVNTLEFSLSTYLWRLVP